MVMPENEPMNAPEIADPVLRDGGVCRACGQAVGRAVQEPRPLAAADSIGSAQAVTVGGEKPDPLSHELDLPPPSGAIMNAFRTILSSHESSRRLAHANSRKERERLLGELVEKGFPQAYVDKYSNGGLRLLAQEFANVDHVSGASVTVI